MLALLQARLNNSPQMELKQAMLEQEKITALRLQKIIS
jgi:2-oxo-4-hydroxy-4-carboxy-5-ureidoimidazoline decarboxylase